MHNIWGIFLGVVDGAQVSLCLKGHQSFQCLHFEYSKNDVCIGSLSEMIQHVNVHDQARFGNALHVSCFPILLVFSQIIPCTVLMDEKE